jgi:hypothetical protein
MLSKFILSECIDRSRDLPIPGGGRSLAHSTVLTWLSPLDRSVRCNLIREMRIDGKLEEEVACRRFEVM